MNRIKCALAILAVVAAPAWAARISQFTPQGTVSKIESVIATFDTSVIPFGDGQAPAPISIQCDDPQAAGNGRWLDAKRWTYVFDQSLGPGVHCAAEVLPSFRTLNNEPLAGKSRFAFQTGGPYVVRTQPYDGSTIAHDQIFALQFNGDVDVQSLIQHSQCIVEGLGESVPLRLIDGDDKKKLLDTLYWSERDMSSVQLLQCKRTLAPEASVQLQIGPGVSTQAADARPAVANTEANVFNFKVEEAFSAKLTCLRENANAPCAPVGDFYVFFTAPIDRASAEQLRLETPAGPRKPDLEADPTDDWGITSVRFKGPFPPESSLSIHLPSALKDDAGRELVNADKFPLEIKTGDFPPLIKFAASPFGVIERFGHAAARGDEQAEPATVPLTVRNVEAALLTQDVTISAGRIDDLVTQDDLSVLRWYGQLGRMNEGSWTAAQIRDIKASRAPRSSGDDPYIDTRGVSLLKGHTEVHTLTLPGAKDAALRPFEVIGVPVAKPGFHVLEVESPRLGAALLEDAKPMYVRTSVLVTNLGVHLKTGRDDAMVWVTTLDTGEVVEGAHVRILNCSGELLAEGTTDARGLWHHRERLDANDYCEDTGLSGLYASARVGADHPLARGQADFAFVFSNWNRGIEPWRFNVDTDSRPEPTVVSHTVFDRNLLRAGETVSMKHVIRQQTREGLAVPPPADRPGKVEIVHMGSGQRYEGELRWTESPSGGLYALTEFEIPKSAKLGDYTVTMRGDDSTWYPPSIFRVEEFKLPLLSGSLKITDAQGSNVLAAPETLTADVQIAYVSGGAAGHLPVTLSGVVRDRVVSFDGYDDYSFYPPSPPSDGDEQDETGQQVLFLDKKAVTLDGQGGARVSIDSLPAVRKPQSLLFEASFADPNGDIQTLSQSVPVWPAQVQAGIRTGSWIQAGRSSSVQAVALDTAGKPQAGVPIRISAQARITYSTRKRMVGGFYSYDSRTETRDLGQVCEGKTSSDGTLACSLELKDAGQVVLIATAEDGDGRVSQAANTLWVVGGDELWFDGADNDRIDVIPARKQWKPGETAQFQVRMPFRRATALIAVEREGVLQTHVATLEGNDPIVHLPIQPEWGPNVYVSVLVLRGRLYEVPWQSFFTWGWRQPFAWYDAYTEAAGNQASATATIDLAKPAFRFGLAQIHISDDEDQLKLKVSADKDRYQIREKARVVIEGRLPDGTPAAGASVAFAAVDQALLELSPNSSWDILGAMRQYRSYGVQTATAQMEIVGRRHYGRKALPAGGGGGAAPTRELLDTLLLWEPELTLDEQGKATIEVPLNDAITRFSLVAVGDYGPQRFGTGKTDIVSTQDLQVIAGMPALIREGDAYQILATVRNTTERAMRVQVEASYTGTGVAPGNLAAQELEVAAGDAAVARWALTAPESHRSDRPVELAWRFAAREIQDDRDRSAQDAVRIMQILRPVVPVRTRQSTILPLEGGQPAVSLPIAAPKGALPDGDGKPRGGLQIRVQSSLAGDMPGVREWFEAYPYTCLEQLSSKAIGLGDIDRWQSIMRSLPDYQDDDGLVSYFPGGRYGDEVLTAYLLTASHEARTLGMKFAIPDESRRRMIHGLVGFVQGKVTRQRWSPQKDLDVRKLLVLEALSRYGEVKPRMLGSIAIRPDQWPTAAVVDWLAILRRVPAISNSSFQKAHAEQVLRARMLARGTTQVFADEPRNNWWWLMSSPETTMAKLMLTVMADPAWKDELPRMAQGLLAMQREGAWRTTTANLLGSLALRKFGRHFEKEPVAGQVSIMSGAGGQATTLDWSKAKAEGSVKFSDVMEQWAGFEQTDLRLEQRGSGRPWAFVRSLAAVPVTEPVDAGYEVRRELVPVSQAVPGTWTRGDVYRVKIHIQARAGMTWVALNDPIPAGATILGSGLGRDSSIGASSSNSEQQGYSPSYVERAFEAYRAYYSYLPAGATTVEYTVRLNTAGEFQLPSTRVEALYEPDAYGELPNREVFRINGDVSGH